MIVGIVLAAGKGTRFKSKNTNKTSVKFWSKPLVKYGTDLFLEVCDKVVVVVEKHSQDVKNSVGKDPDIIYAYQKKQLGTGHAVKVAVEEIIKKGWTPETVFVGMGDHMMFYNADILNRLSKKLDKNSTEIALITCKYDNPDSLFWGRIVRDKKGNVVAIVEQKDASEEQKKINELNAGFYCFRFDFLNNAVRKIKRSKVIGEYYLTDLIRVAKDEDKKVSALKIPFKYVGFGVNTQKELEESQKLFKRLTRKTKDE